MTKRNEKRDQAGELRKKMDESTEEVQDLSTEILNLPPRSEKHVAEEKKTKWRIKHPIVRLLAICFVLIPGTIVAYIIHQQNKQETTVPNHYERVTVQQEKQVEQKPKEEPKAEAKETAKEETKPLEKVTTETSKETTSENKEQSAKQDNMIYHTVQEGDTLYSLAMKYFGNRNGERVIEQYNQLESKELVVGSVLEIPKEIVK